ncbi:hypothetical protein SAMN05216551_109185 [Chitinasiproducens palmae]|uniref:Uncharacterized protein n=2 Tax=Chitinasiproducens palmae TaxID=1770053 RepID=A0A1H2PSA0_9BURK|nr:hypothetical protein SAMN05216551_109185 [Chitinasiproducens palmae]
MKFLLLLVGLSFSALAHADVFTLYRSSRVLENARLHVATFDAKDPTGEYNRSNCEIAADLFQHQDGVKTRFWCEKGSFHEQP